MAGTAISGARHGILFCAKTCFQAQKRRPRRKRASVVFENGVALFVPKFAFTGESSTLQRWQFLLTENLRFCAFLPQIKAQLMKTAPQFTLSRVGIKLRPLTIIYPPRRNFQDPNRYFICRFYGRSKKAVRNGMTFHRKRQEIRASASKSAENPVFKLKKRSRRSILPRRFCIAINARNRRYKVFFD